MCESEIKSESKTESDSENLNLILKSESDFKVRI